MSEYVITLNGKKKSVSYGVNSKIAIEGRELDCELIKLSSRTFLLRIEKRFFEITSNKLDNGNYSLLIDGISFETAIRSALQEKASALLQQKSFTHSKTEIKAPMPGMVLKVNKNAGDKINHGETIVILEAMKMENDIRAPHSGSLKEVFINEGTAVEKGSVLFTIE